MNPRLSLLTLGCLLLATTCFGQSAPSDSQTLQTLLSEVRQIRLELRTTTIAAQRSQILIYRLQGEEARVARASQRLDEAREKLARTQDERKHVAAEVKQTEDFVNNTDNPAAQRKTLENRLSELKTRLESSESDEQRDQSQEIDAEQQLRAEEAKLSDLRDQLDRLDKTLENAGRKSDGGVQ
jgi:chromosome segregation ATPase